MKEERTQKTENSNGKVTEARSVTSSLTKEDKLKEITDQLEKGVVDLFESENYERYLKVMSKLHTYSFNNSLLIAMQRPDATMVAGYTSWKANFHRNVNKGEKAIKILAPAPYKIKKDVEKVDPLTKEPVLGIDGKPVKERVQVIVPAYKIANVFDVSQTSGEELPEIAMELKGDIEGYEALFEAIKRTSPVPVEFGVMGNGANGYYHLTEKKILLREGMSQVQNIKTAIHEVAHAKLHDKDTGIEKDHLLDSRTKEVEAESVAYTVCQHFGIDTSEYSFGYIASWSKGKNLEELKSSMNTIRITASEIIKHVSSELNTIKEEKELAEFASELVAFIKGSSVYQVSVEPLLQEMQEHSKVLLKEFGYAPKERFMISMTEKCFPKPRDAFAIWDFKKEEYYGYSEGKIQTFGDFVSADDLLKELQSDKKENLLVSGERWLENKIYLGRISNAVIQKDLQESKIECIEEWLTRITEADGRSKQMEQIEERLQRYSKGTGNEKLSKEKKILNQAKSHHRACR